MLLVIQHETELTYTGPIAETVMELRMTPRTDAYQTLRGLRIDVAPAAPLYEHVDWLGNRVHQFSLLPSHDRLVIYAQSGVETKPAQLSLEDIHDTLPLPIEKHRVQDFTRFGGLIVRDDRLGPLAERLGLRQENKARVIIDRVMSRLCDHIEYRKGVTTSSTTLSHALDEGAGVCQDLAHIAAGLLRACGIPARYVSGYYYSASGSSEVETHAWCEAFCPSKGWLPIDPTHRAIAGRGHVSIAMGRDFSDVPPNRGVYRGSAEEKISVRVNIEEVEQLPELLLAPRFLQIGGPLGDAVPRVHREQLDYQQEQQQQ